MKNMEGLMKNMAYQDVNSLGDFAGDASGNLGKVKNDHTMKIFHHISTITANEAEFVKSCGSTDIINAAQLLIKKSYPLHNAFLNLEKVSDWVLQKLIWYALQPQLIPDELNGWVILYYI